MSPGHKAWPGAVATSLSHELRPHGLSFKAKLMLGFSASLRLANFVPQFNG